MMAWLLGIWGRLKGWLLIAAAVAAALFAAFWRGRQDGKRAAELQRERDRIDAMREAKGVDDEVEGLGDADLDQRYRRWLRRGP